MKETRLTEFEEIVLHLTGILEEDAYAVRLVKEVKSQNSRILSLGAIHSLLNRLENRGFVTSI